MDALDVVLVTWPNHPKRMAYLRRTWDSLQRNLIASQHAIRYLCSSESEQDPKCEWRGGELEDFCEENGIALHWREGKASLGAGMNSAVRLCTSPVYVLHQDDFELQYPLDLSPIADFMLRHTEVAMFRLSYYTHPIHGTKFLDEMEPGFRRVNIRGDWPYGDDPHMRRQDFVDRWGEYTEGNWHGASEGNMFYRLVHNRAVIAAGMHSYYGHIGQIASVPDWQERR